MVLWFCGAVVLWFHSPVVLWFCGAVVLWFHSPVVLWFCGAVVLWFHSPVVPCSCGPIVPWSSCQDGAAGWTGRRDVGVNLCRGSRGLHLLHRHLHPPRLSTLLPRPHSHTEVFQRRQHSLSYIKTCDPTT